jgi:hypothetical protein
MTRASMLEIHGQDYIRTAYAKGLSEHRITYVHVLRNAVLPVVTVAGMQVGALLGGSVLVETVFGWPGLGRLAFEAVIQRDANLLLGHPVHVVVAGDPGQHRGRHALRGARSADRDGLINGHTEFGVSVGVLRLLGKMLTLTPSFPLISRSFWRSLLSRWTTSVGLAILLA